MNQMPPHLSLEALVAAARGEETDPPAAGHLATCGECAGEVRAWNAIAGGTRLLVSRYEAPSLVIDRTLAAIDDEPGSPARPVAPAGTASAGTAPRGLRGRRRAWLAAAAAVVLLGGVGYGVVRSVGSGHPATRTGAALTATGCSSLKAVGGTLTSASGSTLTIKAADGDPVTVTTSQETTVLREVTGSLGDITDGVSVTVFGTNSGGRIDAKSVALRSGAAVSQVKPPDAPGRHGGLSPRLGVASGTVTDVTGSGFTVEEADGSTIEVITSAATTVLTLVKSSIGQLKSGSLTSAVGDPGPNGTLAATMVEQDALAAAPVPPSPPKDLPSGLPKPGPGAAPPSPPARPAPGTLGSLLSGLGCSQDAITTVYLMSLED